MITTPFWKKIYQTVSAYSRNVTEDIVAEILKLSSKELSEGLLAYKPYSKQSYEVWTLPPEVQSDMKEFIHDLSQYLNLDISVAYSIMCNYLMFEFYGKIKDFWIMARRELSLHLKELIWNFYTAERTFLLKTWRHILEFIDDENCDFARQYKEFFGTVKIEELQDKIIKQFESLLNELTLKHFHRKNPLVENCLQRNIGEQIELLLILTLTVNQQPLNLKQMTELFKLFALKNFSTVPPLYELRLFIKQKDMEELMFTEIGCYFSILEVYWDKNLKDFWNDQSTTELQKLMLGLHMNPGQALVILTWFILKFKSGNSNFEEEIGEIFGRKPLVLLHTMLSSQIFKDSSAGNIIVRASHRVVDELCLMYAKRNDLYEEPGIVGVIVEFLRVPQLAEICLQTRNGIDRLMEIAVEAFPLDFMSLTQISVSLLEQPSYYKEILHLLNNLPSFLSEVRWTTPSERVSILTKSQPAFNDSSLIVFRPGTTVRAYETFGHVYLQYKSPYSYFHYLEYLVHLLLADTHLGHKFNNTVVEKVVAGFGVVVQVIKTCLDMDLQVIGIDRVLLKFNKLLVLLNGSAREFNLVKLYFVILNAIISYRRDVFFEYCPDIVWRCFMPKVTAELCGAKVENLLLNPNVFEDTILLECLREEELTDDHGLLLAYINILQTAIKMRTSHENFKISGLTYMLGFVFPKHKSWSYKNEYQKTEIALECLKLFHYILQQDVAGLGEFDGKLLHLCQHALLNNPVITDTFIRLFTKEKYYLLFVMERETNWFKGPALDKLQCIRLQLALLLILINKRQNYGKCIFDDKIAYVVKPVAYYFTNAYNPLITELSCRFLEKLAQNPTIPLLPLLEMDYYQIQLLFLERLRDPLEEDKVKIAIIDLINTCISCQNGMTAAFFNIPTSKSWDGKENEISIGDSVSDFMVDYLQNIKKSHAYFKHPLQLGILNLLHNLWRHGRQNLLTTIINLKDFWPVMLEPFFCDFVQEIEVYSVILKIVNMELAAHADKVDRNLLNVIEKFLKDMPRVEACVDFLLAFSKTTNDVHLDFVQTWIEFLVLVKTVSPDVFTPNLKYFLVDSCLNGLNTPPDAFHNLEIIYLWSQLYLILISYWSVFEQHESELLAKLNKFLCSLTTYYKYLTPKIKQSILYGVHRTINRMEKFFTCDTSSFVHFLYSVGVVIDAEYEHLQSIVWGTKNDEERIKLLQPWLIIVCIGNAIMPFDSVHEIAAWFLYLKFLFKVMDTVGPLLESRATLSFAKLPIHFLLSYAESPLATHYIGLECAKFYSKIQPPSLLISLGEALSTGVPIPLKEWWLILTLVVKLNSVLLQKFGLVPLMSDACFLFPLHHHVVIRQILSLVKCTVDVTALNLVAETVKLVQLFMSYRPCWQKDTKVAYFSTIDGLRTALHASSMTVMSYKRINFYEIKGDVLFLMVPTPADLLVRVIDKLCEIIFLSSTCLRELKRNVMVQKSAKKQRDPILAQRTKLLCIDLEFNVPRFQLPDSAKLTYGTLLSAADYLFKLLNQLSSDSPRLASRIQEVSIANMSDETKSKSLTCIFEECTAKYENCTSFLFNVPTDEKLKSYLHHDKVDFSSTSAPSLDFEAVKHALEGIMMFVANEFFYSRQALSVKYTALVQFEREFSSEIQFFYELVRKKTCEDYSALVATPRSKQLQGPFNKYDTDIIKKYVRAKVKDNAANDIADNNFLLIISHWLMKICRLSN